MGAARPGARDRLPADHHDHDGPRRLPLTGRGLVADGVPVGVAPRRAALDQVLVDAAIEAGAEFRDGFGVHDLIFEDNRVTGIRGHGGLTEQGRFVIGADGRNSRDDPQAMARFCLAWEGRISRPTSSAGLYEPPRAQ